MEKINKPSPLKNNVRYPLAAAYLRIIAKVIDLLLVGGVCFGVCVGILISDKGFFWSDQYKIIDTWRYTLCTTFIALIFFSYMILLPNFWNGQTIGKKLFKLKYYNLLPLSSFIINLIKHDLFIWIILICINFFAGIVLACLSSDDAAKLLNGMLYSGFKTADSSVWYYVGGFFSTLTWVNFLITLMLVILMCVKSKKASPHDNFSHVVVLRMVAIDGGSNKNKNIKQKPIKINYGLPGDISSESFVEIDNLGE